MEFESESRNRLYHNRYEYGVCLYVPYAGFLRQLDHDVLDDLISYRNNRQGRWSLPMVTSEQSEKLHQLCDALCEATESIKKICYSNHLYLYSNDLSFLIRMRDHPSVIHLWSGRAVVDQPSGVIIKKNSPYKFRTFFYERYLSTQELSTLTGFLDSRRDRYRASPTVSSMVLNGQRRYLRNYYFIDHRDHNDLLLLNLAMPDLIRKTIPIVTK